MAHVSSDVTVTAGPLAGLMEAFEAHGPLLARLWARDHTLWRDDPTEITDRLGWLDAPVEQAGEAGRFEAFAEQVVGDGFTDVVVIGMGGSSLFPDVLARTFPPRRLRLTVLDSTHPAAVARALALGQDTTLFCVASKSGSTLETRSHLEAAWASRQSRKDPGGAFVAITDPGSALGELAVDRGFRAVFEAPPDVGGRFSAMTPFGLVPAALLGVDVARLLASAREELEASQGLPAEQVPGLRLGVLLAVAARAGRDKVSLLFGGEASPFGDWVEQLVAESLGKHGISVVPVAGEDDASPGELQADDRVHVALGDPAGEALAAAGEPVFDQVWHGPASLGAQVVRWEIATAVAGALLGVHPFDQPDVASAKAATSAVLDAGLSEVRASSLDDALSDVNDGDLLAITAFVDPAGTFAAELPRIQAGLRAQLGVAVTVGIGPRYLHSTGQLHKGGSDRIVVLQVVDVPGEDVAIPGESFSFATLLAAQAEGDLVALRARGRRAHRVAIDELRRQAI